MLRHYLHIAWRQLVKHRGANVVKLVGLSIGMACCMLILVYLSDELSYNTFHRHYADIYRVNFNNATDRRKMSSAPVSAGPAIAQDVPGIVAVGRLYNRSGIMEAGSLKYQETGVVFADRSIFDIFSFHFLEGAPGGLVLTRDMARKYFGQASAVGRTLVYEHKAPLQVTGVVDNWPATSDIHFDFLIPFETLYSVENQATGDFLRTNWLFNPADTYVLLHPGQDAAALAPAVRGLTRKYGDERVAKFWSLSLQPLRDIHLYASDVEGNPSTNSITYIYIFVAIAFLILVIANINFINLSNAQALTRIAEIGVRKVAGAGHTQLILQFLGEGLLLCFIAFLLGLGLAFPALPLVREVTGEALHPAVLGQGRVVGGLLLLFLCTGLMAGLYPALFITRFGAGALIKGRTKIGGRLIRQVLIVTQFTIAVALIIGAVVIHRQLSYLREKPLGFRKDQVLVLPLFGKASSPISNSVDGPLRARMNAFEDDLRAYSGIQGVTLASVLPGTPFVEGLVIPQGFTERDNIFLPWASVDYDFIETMGIQVVAGRGFSKAAGTDNTQAFILNESAVRRFGWASPRDAIGKTMIRGNMINGKRGFVIGVVKDFNFAKLDQPLQPMIMDVNVPRFTTFAVRVSAPSALAYIRSAWSSHFPDLVFDYSFLDEDINALYKAQENLSRLVGYFAALAIFISGIGIFSLASFVATRRTKEIGIRKVLGAGTRTIVVLLLRDFQVQVVLALLLASPLAWFAMNRWLHDFAYRTSIGWGIFAFAAAGTLAVTILTVGFHGVRASLVNPVESLRVD
ncbi:ABC transporter permease [Dinghuibacter silviterrae]|nr:ABC transporter permease [Dinghuibacter silviterrae]